MKKMLIIVLSLVLALSALSANGGSENGKSENAKITLKIGDDHPDRKNGVGAVLERINAEFIVAHPEVDILVESYNDQPWQEKVKIYATANQLPDVMCYWSFPTLLKPLVDADMILPLDMDHYKKYGYMAGSLEGNSYDGVLYGIPKSADLWVLYINKGLYEKAGVPIPQTWEDIIASVPAFKAIGVTPVVTNGKEGWPLCELFDNIAQRINGDFSYVGKALDRTMRYTDDSFVEAARYIQSLVKAGVFQENLTTSDYGDARNMFGQERAAIYMMGSWEMSLAGDQNFSESFRKNLDVITFPVVKGGKGKATDTLAWYGGNFIISDSTKHADLAKELLDLIAEKYGQYCWDSGAAFPANSVKPSDKDSLISKKLLAIADASTMTSGTPGLDAADNVFKEDHQELMRQLCALMITPEDFAKALDASAERAYRER